MIIKTKIFEGQYGMRGFTLHTVDSELSYSYGLQEGEPEDMIFGRNLEGPRMLHKMLEQAHRAGKRGEELEFEEEVEE